MQIQRVSVTELRAILRRGEMLLPAMSTCYLALEELSSRGLLAEGASENVRCETKAKA